MDANRRMILSAVAGALALGLAPAAMAQDFPNKPVTLVIPYPAGGPTDLVGRLVAQGLEQEWKQPVVVENKPGASGSLGSGLVADAAPDGYTLVLGNNASHGAYELLNPSVAPYKTLEDFAPVALIGTAPLIMIVGPNLDVKDFKEFLAYAKANPGKINYASAAIGSSPHLASEMLKQAAGIDMVHVPFNGTAPAIQALLSKAVDVYMGGKSSVWPHVEAGNAKAMGVVAGERLSSLPDLPTLEEQGLPGLSFDSWYGLLAPAGTPDAILDKINADVNKVMGGDEMAAKLEGLGFDRKLGSRAEAEAMIRASVEKSASVIKFANIPVN